MIKIVQTIILLLFSVSIIHSQEIDFTKINIDKKKTIKEQAERLESWTPRKNTSNRSGVVISLGFGTSQESW